MRFTKFTDFNERTYDSCLPSYSDMISLSSEKSQFTFNGDAVERFFTNDLSEIFESNLSDSKITQFPFEKNPLRNVQDKSAIVASNGNDLASFPSNVTGVELDPLDVVYRTGYSFASKSPANLLPDYTRVMKPFEPLESYDPDDYPAGVSLTQGLVSSYFMTSSADETLYDLSGIGNHLSLRPVLASVTHPSPTESALAPVQGLTDDGSLQFSSTINENDVQFIAARTAMSSHKMSFSAGGSDFDVKFTMTMTLRRGSLGTTQYLLQRGDELGGTVYNTSYEMFIDSSNRLVFRIYEGSSSYKGINSNAITLNSTSIWYNVTVVYNGEQTNTDGIDCLEMWVNGNLVTPQSDNSGAGGVAMQEDDSWRLWIGAGRKSSAQPSPSTEFVGTIHSLHIWKGRMLTDVEVAAVASAELNGTSLGIISHRTSFPQFSQARPTRNGTFRYGISNIQPEFSSIAFRPDHYGHLRDMLESRPLTARFDGFKPLKIRFVSGSQVLVDPTGTHAQNLSTFATSSMPYFDDGIARNRDDNPDETLLSV